MVLVQKGMLRMTEVPCVAGRCHLYGCAGRDALGKQKDESSIYVRLLKSPPPPLTVRDSRLEAEKPSRRGGTDSRL